MSNECISINNNNTRLNSKEKLYLIFQYDIFLEKDKGL